MAVRIRVNLAVSGGYRSSKRQLTRWPLGTHAAASASERALHSAVASERLRSGECPCDGGPQTQSSWERGKSPLHQLWGGRTGATVERSAIWRIATGVGRDVGAAFLQARFTSSLASTRRRRAWPIVFVCSVPCASVDLSELRSRPNLLQRRLCSGSPGRKATRGRPALPNQQ
jgi:hypothetical protein